MRTLPPAAGAVLLNLLGLALGLLLILGSIRLRRRRPSGVALCTAWSWLAIAWLAVDTWRGLRWLAANADEVDAVAEGLWQGYAGCGVSAALVLLLAYPVFLLVWLARPAVRQETGGWPE